MTESANEHESLCMCGLCETKRVCRHDSAAPAAPPCEHECGNAGLHGTCTCVKCGALYPNREAGTSVRPEEEERKDASEYFLRKYGRWATGKEDFMLGWLARAAVTREEVMPNEGSDDLRSRPQSVVTGDAHPSEHAEGLSGALWLCYHALKQIEWRSWDEWDNRICPCCEKMENEGHNKDCMVGNGLKAMAAVTRTDK